MWVCQKGLKRLLLGFMCSTTFPFDSDRFGVFRLPLSPVFNSSCVCVCVFDRSRGDRPSAGQRTTDPRVPVLPEFLHRAAPALCHININVLFTNVHVCTRSVLICSHDQGYERFLAADLVTLAPTVPRRVTKL